MTFKEKVELAMYAMLWTKAMTTFVLTRNYACWYDFSVTIVTNPRLFTEKTAENVFREFQRTPHEEAHLRDLEFKLANWRPKLAMKLDISAATYDFLMEAVRDPRFSDRLVMYLFERFMDKSTSRIDSVDIYRTMKINRPHLAEAFEVKTSTH